jgi:hypothetical protein
MCFVRALFHSTGSAARTCHPSDSFIRRNCACLPRASSKLCIPTMLIWLERAPASFYRLVALRCILCFGFAGQPHPRRLRLLLTKQFLLLLTCRSNHDVHTIVLGLKVTLVQVTSDERWYWKMVRTTTAQIEGKDDGSWVPKS